MSEFAPYVAGLSIDEIRERYHVREVVKMASNENPLGVSPVVLDALSRHIKTSFRYPRAGNPELRQIIAEHCGVRSENIVPGNGSDEIIDLLIRILCRPGHDNIVAFKPCFSIYELQARLCGVEFRQARLAPDFSFDWQSLISLVDERTKIVFVTNPDNPSGYAVRPPELRNLVRQLPETALLVVDEAYVDFASPLEEFTALPFVGKDQIVVLRTFSKLYGLAGLRLGYGVFPEALADALQRVRLPFSVNVLAEAAGMAVLKDAGFIHRTLDTVLTGRKRLAHGLESMGCRVWPSQSNFLMFRPPIPAEDLFESLLRRGIIIRPLKSYGLNEMLRVSIGTARENEFFLQVMAEILSDE